MSISDQLVEQYRAKAAGIKAPANQRQVYRELFERQQAMKSTRVVRRRPLLLIGLAIVALVVIAGFTSYTWVHYGDDRVKVEYSQTTGEALSIEQSKPIYQRLANVQAQLASGETAVVYLPEILRFYPEVKGMELLAVSNPTATTDYEAWDNTLVDRDENVKRLPKETLGIEFVRGIEESYFGGAISPEALKLLPEMKSESEANGGTDVWRRVDPFTDLPFPIYTSIYRNTSQEEIFISTQWFDQKGGIKGVTGATELEKVEVNGITVQYKLEEPFIFTNTSRLQTLQWVETFEDRSLVYTVGTSSLTLTKEDLIAVLKALQSEQ
mgnify:CR=1 FL=1|jgi:hypothetical protein